MPFFTPNKTSSGSNALDLVELARGRPALLLRRLGEALRERREDRELPVRHRLELDLQGQHRRRRVDLDILRAQMPELVREDDGLVVPLRFSFVTFWQYVDI